MYFLMIGIEYVDRSVGLPDASDSSGSDCVMCCYSYLDLPEMDSDFFIFFIQAESALRARPATCDRTYVHT